MATSKSFYPWHFIATKRKKLMAGSAIKYMCMTCNMIEKKRFYYFLGKRRITLNGIKHYNVLMDNAI